MRAILDLKMRNKKSSDGTSSTPPATAIQRNARKRNSGRRSLRIGHLAGDEIRRLRGVPADEDRDGLERDGEARSRETPRPEQSEDEQAE